jgi:fatty acid desaturase
LYQIASFQVMRNPVSWRWSHARHHTDTIIVGRDAEIAWMHPVRVALKALAFVGVIDAFASLRILGRNALGRLSAEERDYIPETERPRAVRAARVHMSIYALTLLASGAMLWGGWGWGALVPLLLVGLPRLYGCWHMVMTGLLQHGGLAEDVLDHRLNSRTVLMNPVSRWIYWNMNYHVEHHMFPMVPYYNLPRLHALIGHDLPPPSPSLWAAYRELWGAVARQRREPGWYLRRELPPHGAALPRGAARSRSRTRGPWAGGGRGMSGWDRRLRRLRDRRGGRDALGPWGAHLRHLPLPRGRVLLHGRAVHPRGRPPRGRARHRRRHRVPQAQRPLRLPHGPRACARPSAWTCGPTRPRSRAGACW